MKNRTILVLVSVLCISITVCIIVLTLSDPTSYLKGRDFSTMSNAQVEAVYAELFKENKKGKLTIHITTEYGKHVYGGIGSLMNTVPEYTTKKYPDQDMLLFLPCRLPFLEEYKNATIIQRIQYKIDSEYVDLLYYRKSKTSPHIVIFKFPNHFDPKFFKEKYYGLGSENMMFNKGVLSFLKMLEEENIARKSLRKIVVAEHGIGQFVSAIGPATKLGGSSIMYAHMIHDYNYRNGQYDAELATTFFPEHSHLLADPAIDGYIELLASKNVDLVVVASKTLAKSFAQAEKNFQFKNANAHAALQAIFSQLYQKGGLLGISNPVMFNFKYNPFTNKHLAKHGLNYRLDSSIVETRRKIREYLIKSNDFALSMDDLNKPWAFYVGRYDPVKGTDELPDMANKFIQNGGVFILMTNSAVKNKVHYSSKAILEVDQDKYGIYIRAACDVGFFPSKSELFGIGQVESLNSGHLLVTTGVDGMAEYVVSGNSLPLTTIASKADTPECLEKITRMESCVQKLLDGAISIDASCSSYSYSCYDFNSYTMQIKKKQEYNTAVLNALNFIILMRQPGNEEKFNTFIKNTMADSIRFYLESDNGYVDQFDSAVNLFFEEEEL